jgi:hypothetical protein
MEEEIRTWGEAYAYVREMERIIRRSRAVPQDQKDDLLIRLELMSDDLQDIGDDLERLHRTQQPRA